MIVVVPIVIEPVRENSQPVQKVARSLIYLNLIRPPFSTFQKRFDPLLSCQIRLYLVVCILTLYVCV